MPDPDGSPSTPSPANPLSPVDLRQQTVDWWQKNAGVSPAVAEGIARAIGRESSFRPGLVAPDTGGPSAGFYQAHKERMTNLLSNPNWRDPIVQHQWALGQVTGGDPIATAHWNEIKSARSPAEADALWDRYFERSLAGPGSGSLQRGGRATAETNQLGGVPSIGPTPPEGGFAPISVASEETSSASTPASTADTTASAPQRPAMSSLLSILGAQLAGTKFVPIDYDPYRVEPPRLSGGPKVPLPAMYVTRVGSG
jgi:hypothetical protein